MPTDFDNRRDVDLLIARGTGAPALFKNLRDGTFTDIAGDVGLAALGAAPARITAVAAADVNKDGFTDFFFGRDRGRERPRRQRRPRRASRRRRSTASTA